MENYRKFQSAAGKTLKSILITCNARLAPFTAAEVKQLVVGEDQMHLERFGDPDSKNAIFAIFDDTDQRTLGFLHGMMVYQTVRVLCISLGEIQRQAAAPGQLHPRRVPLPVASRRHLWLHLRPALAKHRDVGHLAGQVAARRALRRGDRRLHRGLLRYRAVSGWRQGQQGTTSTCEFISDSCGQQTVFQENYSQSHGGQGSWSKSGQTVGRALIDPAEVAKLPKTECVVLINGANPIVDEKYPLTEHPNYKLMADTPGFDIKKYMAEKRRREEREYSARLASQSKSMPRRTPLRGRTDAEAGKHYKSRDTDSTGKTE